MEIYGKHMEIPRSVGDMNQNVMGACHKRLDSWIELVRIMAIVASINNPK